MRVLSARERYNVALNVAAKFGFDADLQSEYAKIVSMFEGIPDASQTPLPPMPSALPPEQSAQPAPAPTGGDIGTAPPMV